MCASAGVRLAFRRRVRLRVLSVAHQTLHHPIYLFIHVLGSVPVEVRAFSLKELLSARFVQAVL